MKSKTFSIRGETLKNIISIGVITSFTILIFHPLLNNAFLIFSRIFLRIFFGSVTSESQVNLLAGKLTTLSCLLSILFLMAIFRQKIIDRLLAIIRPRENLHTALALCFLSIPGVSFYIIGIKTLQISNFPLIISGLLFTLLIEIFIFLVLFYIASLSPAYNNIISAVLVSTYASLVGALSALVKFSGEMDYLKYIEMIFGANFNYLQNFKIILPATLYLLFVVLIGSWMQNRLVRSLCSLKQMTTLAIAVLILLTTLNPVVMLGEVLALPFRSLQTSFLKTEAHNVNSLVGGHLPRLLTSAIQNQNYLVLTEVPNNLKLICIKFGLFQPPPAPSHGNDSPTFKRIILVTVESLSLDFTNFEQSPCSETITPRIDALMASYPSAALWTNASPTLYGLSTMFSSHPNAKMVLETSYPNSFVRTLKDHGYRTVFIRSAPETYSNEHIYFRKAGFQEIYGRNFFRDEMDWSNHISGWGLEDAYLFRYAIDFLKQNRHDKLFVHLLPADTHTPYGRDNYSDEYPNIPEGLSCQFDNIRLLKSFYRQDFDIGQFYDTLVRENLLDNETLLILTADHSCPRFYNPEPEILERTPIVFISKEKITTLELNQPNISQIDIAPTILSLAGIRPPRGYWGRSLLHKAEHTYFGVHGDTLIVRRNGHVKTIVMKETQDQEESDLTRLLNISFSLNADLTAEN